MAIPMKAKMQTDGHRKLANCGDLRGKFLPED